MSATEEIKKLQAQITELSEKAKNEALEVINKGIETLKELGHHFKLVESGGSDVTPVRTGTRRTGIRDQVKQVVKDNPGITAAQVAAKIGATDKAGKQSVSNALSALKKDGSVKLEGGKYTKVNAH